MEVLFKQSHKEINKKGYVKQGKLEFSYYIASSR